jgi:carboxypeptidase Q
MRISALLAAALGGTVLLAAPPESTLPPETARAATEIVKKALAGTKAAEIATSLTDRAGPRLAGSPGDKAAAAWGVETLRALHFANVHTEKAPVRVWKRRSESGEVVLPWPQPLALTALGGSVATPEAGLEADVLEVTSLEDLDARAAAARGKIVFFDSAMRKSGEMGGYGEAVGVRAHGASRAAGFGALGVLIRSIGTDHDRFPHTGGVDYDAGTPKIPAAALAVPDAEMLTRLGRLGPVRVRFRLACGDEGMGESANVIGELPGAGKPNEIVLLGGHLDSWDLGRGAIDDAAGCAAAIEGARLAGEASPRPARTIRVILFANEENGQGGAKAYAAAHAAELPAHVAALEADSGSGAPTGLSWLAGPSAETALRALSDVLAPAGAARLEGNGSGGADIGVLRAAGVPLFSVLQDMSHYFDVHHTANDTAMQLEPASLDRLSAAIAAFAYAAASAPEPFERIPESQRIEPKKR